MILNKKVISKCTILKKRINFKKADFEMTFVHKKSRFDSFYPLKCATFAFYLKFQKSQFRGRKFFKKLDVECKNFV